MAAPIMGLAQENATPPASNDQTTTPAMGNRGHMRHANPAKRLEWMSKKLNLTDDQKVKLQPILQDEYQQMKAVRDDASLNRQQRHEKMMQIRQTFHPQVTAVLTPEQQQRLEQMKQEHASRRGGKGAPANPDNNTPQPK